MAVDCGLAGIPEALRLAWKITLSASSLRVAAFSLPASLPGAAIARASAGSGCNYPMMQCSTLIFIKNVLDGRKTGMA
ncbi:MAG: hypothetical protein RBS40_16605 [Rhodocyclaceae bacterium]|jgi:hypothetical protein|nr:hypothetical protein [Rhodocyclaceae bacterium]